MKTAWTLIAFTPLLAASALAAPLFEDKGVALENDPYSHDTSLTQGAMEDFRKLYVDPADFAAGLVPAQPLPVVEVVTEPQVPAETATEATETEATESEAEPSESKTTDEANTEEGDGTQEAEVTAEETASVPVTPAAPAPPSKGNLIVHNDVTAWAEVTINGTKVGTIGPVTKGIVHDVASGIYTVDFLLPNGYSYTRNVATTSAP